MTQKILKLPAGQHEYNLRSVIDSYWMRCASLDTLSPAATCLCPFLCGTLAPHPYTIIGRSKLAYCRSTRGNPSGKLVFKMLMSASGCRAPFPTRERAGPFATKRMQDL